MTSNKNLQLPFVQNALKRCLNLRNYKDKANKRDYCLYEKSINAMTREHVNIVVSLKHEVLDRQMSLLKIADESKNLPTQDINHIENIKGKIIKYREQEAKKLAAKYRVKLLNEPKMSNCYQRIKEMVAMKQTSTLTVKVDYNLIYPNFKRRAQFLNSLKLEDNKKEKMNALISKSEEVLVKLRKKYGNSQFNLENNYLKPNQSQPLKFENHNCEFLENQNLSDQCEINQQNITDVFPNPEFPFISRGNTEIK